MPQSCNRLPWVELGSHVFGGSVVLCSRLKRENDNKGRRRKRIPNCSKIRSPSVHTCSVLVSFLVRYCLCTVRHGIGTMMRFVYGYVCGGIWRCPMARGAELGQRRSCIQMCFVLPLINPGYGIVVYRDFLNYSITFVARCY
jgi:hypothetical protein